MDFSRGKHYCELLKSGTKEDEIVAAEGISIQELYNVVDYADPAVSRAYLKHFCSSYVNYVCLSWPLADEHTCSAFGYEPDCPLAKR